MILPDKIIFLVKLDQATTNRVYNFLDKHDVPIEDDGLYLLDDKGEPFFPHLFWNGETIGRARDIGEDVEASSLLNFFKEFDLLDEALDYFSIGESIEVMNAEEACQLTSKIRPTLIAEREEKRRAEQIEEAKAKKIKDAEDIKNISELISNAVKNGNYSVALVIGGVPIRPSDEVIRHFEIKKYKFRRNIVTWSPIEITWIPETPKLEPPRLIKERTSQLYPPPDRIIRENDVPLRVNVETLSDVKPKGFYQWFRGNRRRCGI